MDNETLEKVSSEKNKLSLDQITLQQLIDLMAELNYTSNHTLRWGSISPVFVLFQTMKKLASVQKCKELIQQHPNPVVKFYAFICLVNKEPGNLYKFVKYALNLHHHTITEYFFDTINSRKLPDLFLKIGAPYLNYEEYKKIVISVIERDLDLEFRKCMFEPFQVGELDYNWLRSYVLTNKDPYSLPLLAKYQRLNDIDLIKSFIDSDPIQVFKSIVNFPNPKFWNFMVKYYDEQVKNKRSNIKHPLLKYFYQAITQYKTSESKQFVQLDLDNLTKSNNNSARAKYSFLAIAKDKTRFFEDFYWELWYSFNQINSDVFLYLWKKNEKKCIDIIVQIFSTPKSLKEQRAPNDYTNEYPLIRLFLSKLLDFDEKLLVDTIKSNLDQYSISYIISIFEFILDHELDDLLEQIITKIDNENNPSLRTHMIEKLNKSQEKSINN